jgi:hypothetical protein
MNARTTGGRAILASINPGGKFVVYWAGEAYDAQASGVEVLILQRST